MSDGKTNQRAHKTGTLGTNELTVDVAGSINMKGYDMLLCKTEQALRVELGSWSTLKYQICLHCNYIHYP